LVTPDTDVGPIIRQGIVTIDDTDTPETLAEKVLKIEHRIYPEAIKLLLEERIIIDGMRTRENLGEVMK
jgi:phosphoribosylglycinamide formyltransferase-1